MHGTTSPAFTIFRLELSIRKATALPITASTRESRIPSVTSDVANTEKNWWSSVINYTELPASPTLLLVIALM